MSQVEPQPLGRGKCPAVMLFGVPGSGKTRFIATGGHNLIIRPPSDHTDSIESDADVTELVVSDWARMLEVFQWGQQGGFNEFDWVWLDSISLIQDHLLEDVLADAIARKPARAMNKGGVMVPEYGPDKGEYKINMERINKWVRDMVALAKEGRFCFGITGHPIEWYDPEKEKDVWAPWIQGKQMIPKICGFMNVVAYLSKVEREDKPPVSVLLTEADGFYGKDQFQAMPELKGGRRGMVSPTLDSFTDAIRKSRKTSPAAKKKTTKKPARKRPASRR